MRGHGAGDLGRDGVELIEAAPGIDLDRDIRLRMEFPLRIAAQLKSMPAEVFEG